MKSSSKLIAAAVATALSTGAAHALAPTATITYTFYEGGGAAPENAIYSALYNLLSPSTVDVYSDGGTKASSSYLVVTGTTVPQAGGQAPFNVATNIEFIYKFNKGAFPNGILPFAYPTSASQAQLSFPTIASIASATANGNSGTPTSSNPDYSYTAVNTNNQPTDWGVTDVEVPLFNFFYNLNGSAPLTPSQLAGIANQTTNTTGQLTGFNTQFQTGLQQVE